MDLLPISRQVGGRLEEDGRFCVPDSGRHLAGGISISAPTSQPPATKRASVVRRADAPFPGEKPPRTSTPAPTSPACCAEPHRRSTSHHPRPGAGRKVL